MYVRGKRVLYNIESIPLTIVYWYDYQVCKDKVRKTGESRLRCCHLDTAQEVMFRP